MLTKFTRIITSTRACYLAVPTLVHCGDCTPWRQGPCLGCSQLPLELAALSGHHFNKRQRRLATAPACEWGLFLVHSWSSCRHPPGPRAAAPRRVSSWLASLRPSLAPRIQTLVAVHCCLLNLTFFPLVGPPHHARVVTPEHSLGVKFHHELLSSLQ